MSVLTTLERAAAHFQPDDPMFLDIALARQKIAALMKAADNLLLSKGLCDETNELLAGLMICERHKSGNQA